MKQQSPCRIMIPKNDKPPYTPEQLLRSNGYKGTQVEQADRAAGGPALRKEIRALCDKLTKGEAQ